MLYGKHTLYTTLLNPVTIMDREEMKERIILFHNRV